MMVGGTPNQPLYFYQKDIVGWMCINSHDIMMGFYGFGLTMGGSSKFWPSRRSWRPAMVRPSQGECRGGAQRFWGKKWGI